MITYTGFTGSYCEESCADGTYGIDCSHLCSCKNFADCDKVTGQCLCKPGFTGLYCESSCAPMTYGIRCEKLCNCSNGATCNPANGLCTCPVGFIGDR